MYSKVIIILGGDVGGGKSTHARLLRWYFVTKHRVNAQYLHIKGFHGIPRIILKFVLKLRYNGMLIDKACKYYSLLRILYVYDGRLLSRLFSLISWLNAIDLILVTLIRQFIIGIFYRILIFEDHVVGYANDMMFFFHVFYRKMGKIPGRAAWMLGLMFLMSTLWRKQTHILFLYAPYRKLLARWMKRGTVPEFVEYLAAGRLAGKFMLRLGLNVKFINTSRSVARTFGEVLRAMIQ